jgi:hypothetical protein
MNVRIVIEAPAPYTDTVSVADRIESALTDQGIIPSKISIRPVVKGEGTMEKARQKFNQAWEENPLGTIAAIAGTVTVLTKVIDALSSIQSRRAYAKMMKRGKR